MKGPINVRIRIWFLITATRFELKRMREIEFVLPSVNLISVNTYVLKITWSSLKGFQTKFCKSDNESELPINKFYASRKLVKFNFVKGKVIFKIFVDLKLQFLVFCVCKPHETGRFTDLDRKFYHQFKFMIARA